MILLEEILQVLSLFLILRRQEALFRQLVPVREGASVHDTHAVNTARPFLPEVADHQIYFMIIRLTGSDFISRKVPHRLGLSLPHSATWMNEGVVAHMRGGKGFA